MGKAKTRARKKTVKKGIKRQIKQKKGGTSLSGEQQARINEMMKTMLMRAPQVIQPQTQQNDKQQQQIDTLNKLYSDQMKRNQTQISEIKDLKSLIEEGNRQREQDKAAFESWKKKNKLRQKNIDDHEKRDKMIEEQVEKHEELVEIGRKYDSSTAEGEHRLKMLEMDSKMREKERERKDKEAIIDANRFAKLEQLKQHELDILITEVAALQGKIDSPEFKGAMEKYRDVAKQVEIMKTKRKFAEEAAKRQEEIYMTEAEIAGMKMAEKELRTETPVPIMTKDGKRQKMNTNGQPLWGTPIPSVIDQSKANMAEQIKVKRNLDIDLDKYKTQREKDMELIKNTERMEIENEISRHELAQEAAFQESAEYKKRVLENEARKGKVLAQQMMNEQMRNANEQKRRLIELEARNTVAATFDPENTSPAVVKAQMNEYTNQVIDEWTKSLNQFNEGIGHRKTQMDMNAALESVLGRYDEGTSELAKNNLMRIIGAKTNMKLPHQLEDWNTHNAERATAFMELINSVDPNILTDEESLIGFVNSGEFKKFKWSVDGS